MASVDITKTTWTFSLESGLADQAGQLDIEIDIEAAARDGVVSAVRAAQVHADREAYRLRPEPPISPWIEVEAWGTGEPG